MVGPCTQDPIGASNGWSDSEDSESEYEILAKIRAERIRQMRAQQMESRSQKERPTFGHGMVFQAPTYIYICHAPIYCSVSMRSEATMLYFVRLTFIFCINLRPFQLDMRGLGWVGCDGGGVAVREVEPEEFLELVDGADRSVVIVVHVYETASVAVVDRRYLKVWDCQPFVFCDYLATP